MYPLILGQHSTGLALWALAVVIGLVGSVWLAGRDGHGRVRSLLAFVMMDILFLLGTKLHFWLANWPLVRADGIGAYLWRGFHLPGGVVLGMLLGPLALRAAGLRPLAFGDSVVPAAALAIAVARLGCFANGCCVGHPSEAPWALAFPRGARVYYTHLARGLIAPGAAFSLPVIPLMLGFAAAALTIAVGLYWWRTRRRFVGQLGLAFVALWSTSTAAIEWWRDPTGIAGTPYLWEGATACAVLSLPALIILSYRHSAERAALGTARESHLARPRPGGRPVST